MMRIGGLAVLALLAMSPAAHAAKLDADAVDTATFLPSAKPGRGIDPALVKAGVLLDRAGFSPGEIDGRGGDNLNKAIAAFQKSQGLPDNGALDQATWDKLASTSSDPAVVPYKIARADTRGPFTKHIPAKMVAMAHLRHLGYHDSVELLGEKFHMSPALLRALNPGQSFKRAGAEIAVANVPLPPEHPDAKGPKISRIEVDKDLKAVRAYDQAGKLFAFYPASIGSDEKPAPSGDFTVERVARNPVYTYDPKYAFKGVKAKKAFSIAPGPNNPVGDVWIALSIEGYGIHGTPEPDKVSKRYSHGCIRLTNWDAQALAATAKGTPVKFIGQGAPAGEASH